MKERIEKIKAHLKENKTVYLTGAGCLVVGVVAGLAASKQITVVDSFKIQWKTTTTNEVTTVLARRGHPGNIIKCNETGEIFASQQRAADALGISASNLSQHLKGLQSSVNGKTFVNLGEAQ